jgi:hypothetical protein
MVVNGRVLPVSGGYVHALCCSRRRRLGHVVAVVCRVCPGGNMCRAVHMFVSPWGAVALGAVGREQAGVEPQVGAPELTPLSCWSRRCAGLQVWCSQACVLCG